jgi:hypothetical protein
MQHVDEIPLDHITRQMFVFILSTDHNQLWTYQRMVTIIKVIKGKVHSRTGHKGPEEK